MNTSSASFSSFAQRLVCAASLIALGGLSYGQTSIPSVRPVPQPAAPVTTPGSGFGSPSPSGLPSPTPRPGGLTSRFPSGVPEPDVTPGSPPPGNGAVVVVPPAAPGSPAYGGAHGPMRGDPRYAQYTCGARGPYTPLQIAQSFIGADADRDGELTAVEAQRLTIRPCSLEQMDRNRDGVLTRFEYEDGVR